MSDLCLQLAELSTSLFAANAKSPGDTTEAAREIGVLYATIADLGVPFENLANAGLTSPLAHATREWNKLRGRIDYLVEECDKHTSPDLTDIGRHISWKRVQLISNELQRLAITLRVYSADKNRTSRDPNIPIKRTDFDGLVRIPGIIDQLENDLRTLQLEARRSQGQETTSTELPQIPIPTMQQSDPCNDCGMLQQQLDDAYTLNEELQLKLALRLEQLSLYKDAETVYKQLSEMKISEMLRKQAYGDGSARQAEIASLEYRSRMTEMLIAQKDWPQAEEVARTVWERSKALNRNDHLLTQSSQRHLCVSLRSQVTPQKLREARHIYSQVWTHPDSAEKAEAGDRWVLENGLGLGLVLEEQELYQEAENQYEALWKLDSEAALQLVRLLSKRNEVNKLSPVLKQCISVGDARVKKEASRFAFDAGRRLYEQNMHDKAKSILEELRKAQIAGSETIPTDLQVNGLLAWVYRKLDRLPQAEKLALSVWKQKKDEDILGQSLSTGANLIWILAKQGKPCKIVWKKLCTMKIESEGSCSLADLMNTVQCWRTLAKDLDAFARKKGYDESATAKDVRKQAKELEQRCQRRSQ